MTAIIAFAAFLLAIVVIAMFALELFAVLWRPALAVAFYGAVAWAAIRFMLSHAGGPLPVPSDFGALVIIALSAAMLLGLGFVWIQQARGKF